MTPFAIALALAFTPPAPGTYDLPVIDTVADHSVIESGGKPTTLYDLKGDRFAVVAFVYFSCGEREGCPLSLATLHALDGRLASDAALEREVTLITVSFDPKRDTPPQLEKIRALYDPRGDWRFVTTGGDDELLPLLADFDQTIGRLRSADGRETGVIRHVLKVFLLDRENRVRNVYSAGFLEPELVLNDLKTLLADAAR